MKSLLIVLLFCTYLYSNESEKQYWDEVKNSSDIELLKSYKKQYPNGVFEKIADIKIKRLLKSNIEINKDEDFSWIKGNVSYKFFGIGKANKHFKGKHYQENLARSRAKRELMSLFNDYNLSNKQIAKYNNLLEIKKYTNKKGRIYILVYIDNYNL